VLDESYARLTHARQQAALVDRSAEIDSAPLLNIARRLCEEILG
jgi:hypothetical protein